MGQGVTEDTGNDWGKTDTQPQLALPVRRRQGIVHSSLQEHQQVRSARVRRHTVFHNLPPLAEHTADILVPPCHLIPAQCGFF